MATVNQAQTKACTRCGDEKPFTEEFFYRQPYTRKDGTKACTLHPECKVCMRARTQKWYHDPTNKPKIRRHDNAYHAAERIRVKDEVFRHYGGWVCACCGETEPLFLTLDHINNDGHEFRRKIVSKKLYDMGGGSGCVTYRWLRSHGFPTGYQVLCSNCNTGKRMNNGICPHVEKAQRLEHSS